MFRNILVCADGTPQSRRALDQAIDLADCQHSRLTILTAITRPPSWALTSMTAAGVEPLAGELRREACDALRDAVARVPDCIPVTTILAEEPIREALAAQLRDGDHDLVVLGSHRRGALPSALRGGLWRFALRRCDVPVLIVRAETEGEPEPGVRAVAMRAAA